MVNLQKDKVSIIVPIYNDEKYIRYCINSIINQSYQNLEIILVDDHSKDKSLDICHDYASNDKRIKVIHNTENEGLSRSREIGYEHATGEWICFSDHDDCMNPKAIECLMFYADDKTDIVASKYKNIVNKDFENYVWINEEIDVLQLEHDKAVDALALFDKYEVPGCLWGKIYRRNIFDKIEIQKYKKQFPMIYFEDVMLTSALVKACTGMKILNQYLYIHRVDYNSVSMSPNSLEFNLQTARTADIVTHRLNEPYASNAYNNSVKNYLLVFAKNWYLVWRYHNKNASLLQEMEELFNKYYKIYIGLNIEKITVADICIKIFKVNKVLFCIVICELWFQCVSKMRYKLKSK